MAKHPRINGGFHVATQDPDRIEAWWQSWPDANVGLATGRGLVVIDIDGDKGETSAEDLPLPETIEVRTGRGRHLYYAGNGQSKRGVRPGIDVRGDGGYVVAPPSVHATGSLYEWVHPLGDYRLSTMPGWAVDPDSTSGLDGRNAKSAPRSLAIEQVLREGQRNDGLYKLACSLRHIGLNDLEIDGALQVANATRCQPPLGGGEVTRVAQSAGQRPVGRVIDRTLLSLGLGPIPTTVYLALRSMANPAGQCWPSLDTLADRCRVGRTATSYAVHSLRDHGLIGVERRPFTSNLYTLLDPDQLQSSEPRKA